MGDFFKTGTGARLVANVFDVATGAKLRSAVQQAPQQDSLLTAFTPLARGVLAVPPPSDAKMGDWGTTRLDAYQEYLLGVRATNADQMLEARPHLERAIALDSTFALAHFQFSYALGWGEARSSRSEALRHALAAARLGTGLPRRERALIYARVAGASREQGKESASAARSAASLMSCPLLHAASAQTPMSIASVRCDRGMNREEGRGRDKVLPRCGLSSA
ncbi:MAG: hypothetical protein ABI969_16680 [bacterium]